jgi:uncharacterized membrane protein YoaK (UPF0700 family)
MDAPFPKSTESLRLAFCLSGAGGYLDAFTWIGHGRVFANAQSGNVVLLGIDLATAQWFDASRRLMPIVAFFFGVLAAYWVKGFSKKDERQVGIMSLGFEIVVLLGIPTLPPTFADIPIVLVIAFVAAFQSSIFTRLEVWSYNSVMTTGNLRKATESLFQAISGGNRDALTEAGIFGAVCLSFCLGAGTGAIATQMIGNVATIGAAILIGGALVLRLRTNRTPRL